MSNLISASELNELTDAIVLDCRAVLTDENAGFQQYLTAHIPSALHVHLENDLSSAIVPGKTGRHPLPKPADFQALLQRLGVELDSTVVVYDQNNAMFAARAWWLLRWAGVETVKVLNGGLDAWLTAELPTESGSPKSVEPSNIEFSPNFSWVVSATDLQSLSANQILLDARALPRYKGDVEPLDAKAGHIPGAWNADFTKNLSQEGSFLNQDALEERFNTLQNKETICYCGSGVTACHNILAITEAGLPMPKLYPGSWSEWITQSSNEIATGEEGII